MADLKRSEISLIEKFVAWPRGLGYVLDYSDRTFGEFFEDEFRIEIYVPAYRDRGTSKRHHLISFCLKEPASIVARVLRTLADERHRLAAASDPTPSRADVEMTSRLRDALKTIDVDLHDHIVVAAGAAFSFREKGLL